MVNIGSNETCMIQFLAMHTTYYKQILGSEL